MRILIPVPALILAACTSTGVVPTGDDTYMIAKKSAQVGIGPPVKTQAAVYAEANEHCAKKQKSTTMEAIEQIGIETFTWSKCEVLVDAYCKNKARRDTDNLIGSLKSMYDGIVLAGVVKDDTPDEMARPEPRMLVDKTEPRIEITIRRIR